MKKLPLFALLLGLTFSTIGCETETEPVAPATPDTPAPEATDTTDTP